MIVNNIMCGAAGIAAFVLAAHAQEMVDNGRGGAVQKCPEPHEDYRKPTPVWGGFGYQVNACPGDRVEVAARLVVSQDAPKGIVQIPQTLPWNVDLSGLSVDQVQYLRDHCETDLPCVGHFKITVLKIGWRDLSQWCEEDVSGKTCRTKNTDGPSVIATLDGFRP